MNKIVLSSPASAFSSMEKNSSPYIINGIFGLFIFSITLANTVLALGMNPFHFSILLIVIYIQAYSIYKKY